jgi:hypothetical protein
MSKRALEFVETWVSEHIYPEDSPAQVDVSAAKGSGGQLPCRCQCSRDFRC